MYDCLHWSRFFFNYYSCLLLFYCGGFVTACNKVRKKEGSGQGWLVKTGVILFKQINLKQVRTLRVLDTSTLSVVSAFTLCIRFWLSPSHRPCARVFTPSLSSNPRSTDALFGLSTPITAIRDRCSSFCTWPTYLPLSPESFSRCRLRWTTPPSPHTPTARLRPGSPPACSPPPPIPGEEVGYSHLRPRPVDHLEFEGL